ncbi:substrate-binding domain-containing protein [Streptomyces sp. NBC_00663]|uniref:substrate-binding domain-containing protein n=1 Tax=Streptomyces sp. NBC_00663 TaxID=2975801 RepID=UPI003FCCAA90
MNALYSPPRRRTDEHDTDRTRNTPPPDPGHRHQDQPADTANDQHKNTPRINDKETRTPLDTHPEPHTVLAFNDRCATGVLDVLLRAGVTVPDEVSVVGFDDTRLARLAHIGLTTVAHT